jgi:hypothetical protein
VLFDDLVVFDLLLRCFFDEGEVIDEGEVVEEEGGACLRFFLLLSLSSLFFFLLFIYVSAFSLVGRFRFGGVTLLYCFDDVVGIVDGVVLLVIVLIVTVVLMLLLIMCFVSKKVFTCTFEKRSLGGQGKTGLRCGALMQYWDFFYLLSMSCIFLYT